MWTTNEKEPIFLNTEIGRKFFWKVLYDTNEKLEEMFMWIKKRKSFFDESPIVCVRECVI